MRILKTEYVENGREQAIAKARKLVTKYDSDSKRAWLISSRVLCYRNPNYPTEVHVLEGSPARGYVLVADNFVLAFDIAGNPLRRYDFEPGYITVDPSTTKDAAEL